MFVAICEKGNIGNTSFVTEVICRGMRCDVNGACVSWARGYLSAVAVWLVRCLASSLHELRAQFLPRHSPSQASTWWFASLRSTVCGGTRQVGEESTMPFGVRIPLQKLRFRRFGSTTT